MSIASGQVEFDGRSVVRRVEGGGLPAAYTREFDWAQPCAGSRSFFRVSAVDGQLAQALQTETELPSSASLGSTDNSQATLIIVVGF